MIYIYVKTVQEGVQVASKLEKTAQVFTLVMEDEMYQKQLNSLTKYYTEGNINRPQKLTVHTELGLYDIEPLNTVKDLL